MIRKLSIVALLGAAASAHAQSSVSIYGVVATGPEYLTNVNAQGASLVRMPNISSLQTSKLGFRGVEDLGGGLSSFFNLELGIGVDSGVLNSGGRLTFSNVGITGPFGRVTLGRQNNMTAIGLPRYLLGPSLYSIASQESYFPSAISDNAIGYVNTVGNVTAGATYSLGRNAGPNGGNPACAGEVAGDRKACVQWTVGLKYDTGVHGAALSYDTMRGGPGGAAPLTATQAQDRRTLLIAWSQIGAVKIGGGVLNRNRSGATPLDSKLYFLDVGVPVTSALSAEFEVSRMQIANSPNDTDMAVARAVYSFSKSTSVFIMGARVWNHGAAAVSVSAGGTTGPGMSQTGIHTGIRRIF